MFRTEVTSVGSEGLDAVRLRETDQSETRNWGGERSGTVGSLQEIYRQGGYEGSKEKKEEYKRPFSLIF
jgi:hypothetical protein